MGGRTAQDFFWALAVAGVVYLVLEVMGAGFLSYLIAASVFSWTLKGNSDEKEAEVQSILRPPREFGGRMGTPVRREEPSFWDRLAENLKED